MRMKTLAESISAKYGIDLIYDQAVLECLCRHGVSAEFGARELTRTIQRLIEIPAIKLLQNQPLPEDYYLACLSSDDNVTVAMQAWSYPF